MLSLQSKLLKKGSTIDSKNQSGWGAGPAHPRQGSATGGNTPAQHTGAHRVDARQVGLPWQLAVIEDREENMKDVSREVLAERERKPVGFHVIINPILTLETAVDVEFFEGCLSVPGLMALVPRARKVKVECVDENGHPRVIRASGWHARILQHEIDHLSGALYVDRMRSTSLCSLDNYARHWKSKSVAEVKRLLP
jgi:peptide deformylase